MIWQVYAYWLDDDLLFPSFTQTATMFWGDMQSGLLLNRTITSLQTLAIGYGCGLAIATAFTTFAVISKIGTRILSTLDRHVQSAAGDRAVADGPDLVRTRHAVAGVRDHPFGAVGGCAQHA